MKTDPIGGPYVWMHEAAFERLRLATAHKGQFVDAWPVYMALAFQAGETDSEPGPDHDGRPFASSLVQIALPFNLPLPKVRKMIRSLARLGFIDPVKVPRDALLPFTLRLRRLETPGEGAATPEGA